jgi:hypothetical protein
VAGETPVAEQNVVATAAPQTPHAAPELPTSTTVATPATGPGDGIKTSRVIALLKREGGVTPKRTHDRDGLAGKYHPSVAQRWRLTGKKYGLTVASANGADGDRTYSIPA